MRTLAATCIFMVTLSVMRTSDALCYDSADCGSSGCCTLGMAIWLLKKIYLLARSSWSQRIFLREIFLLKTERLNLLIGKTNNFEFFLICYFPKALILCALSGEKNTTESILMRKAIGNRPLCMSRLRMEKHIYIFLRRPDCIRLGSPRVRWNADSTSASVVTGQVLDSECHS